MTTKILTAVLVLAALIMTACGGQTQPTAAPGVPTTQPTALPASTQPSAVGADNVAGTSWTLTTLNGQPTLKGTTITLNFGAGKVAGSDGCNNYNGSYTADGTHIKFSQPLAATMKACPDPIMNQATAYMQALGQAATYKVDAQQLALSDASGKELATFGAQSSDLAGTAWIVTGYNNGQGAVTSVAVGTELTANFGADGQLSGNAGCNSYSASYQTAGPKITIGPAITTKMACEQAVMDQEQQYLSALASAATYRVDGTKLELRTAAGALAASFQKVAASSSALPGTSWIVTGYNNGKGAVTSTMAGTALTAKFGTDGNLNGKSGCNSYSAPYLLDEKQINIGPAVTTKMACEQALMDQEQQYLAALASAATYRIDGSKLELRTTAGALAATFQQVKP